MTWPIYRMPACMGGHCQVRGSCARYHEADRREPSERLCERGGTDHYEPMRATRTEHVYEQHALAVIQAAA